MARARLGEHGLTGVPTTGAYDVPRMPEDATRVLIRDKTGRSCFVGVRTGNVPALVKLKADSKIYRSRRSLLSGKSHRYQTASG